MRTLHGVLVALARVLVAVVLSSLCAPGLAGRADPATGRVRILYVGDGWGPSPVPSLLSDPAFTLVSVPTSTLHADVAASGYGDTLMRKFVRLYMPRSYEAMLSENDLTILSDANLGFIGQNHLDWIRDSTTHEGFGLIMVGGVESFGAPKGLPWTPLEDMLPVDISEDMQGGYYYPSFKVEPATDHPFTRSLPWASMPFFHGMNRVKLKEGATLLLRAEGHPHPPLSYWDYGEGRSVAHAPDWTPASGGDVMRWEFYLDYVANICYLATGARIPEDAHFIHSLRTSFWSSRIRLTTITDTLGFAEIFGANTHPVEVRLGEARGIVSEAEALYMRQEYDAAKRKLGQLDETIIQLQRAAIALKDSALIWVHLIEWVVTASTLMIAGLLVWTLMVGRRLYREVGETRTTRPRS
jgi:hypothetical protein